MTFKLTATVALAASLACSIVIAAPRVLEETTRVILPDQSYLPESVAVDGDSLIVVGFRSFPDQPDIPDAPVGEHAAMLFERSSSGTWVFVKKLATLLAIPWQDYGESMTVSMRDGVAAIMPDRVFERTSAGWVEAPSDRSGWIPTPSSGFPAGVDVDVQSGMILEGAGDCGVGAALLEKDATGTWARTNLFLTGPRDPACNSEFGGAAVDTSSNRVIVRVTDELHIWNRNANRSWPAAATAIVPLPADAQPSLYGPKSSLAAEGDYAVIRGSPQRGLHVARNNGGWGLTDRFWRPDSVMVGDVTSMEMVRGITPIGYPADSLRAQDAGSVSVFQLNPSGNFDYVAKLTASDASSGAGLGRHIGLSGRRVVAATGAVAAVYVYDLPADLSQPAIVQSDFEDGTATGWIAIPGSNFAVTPVDSTKVYRQKSTERDAGATRTSMDWRNQSIEAIVTPRAFGTTSGEKWFGLTVRQTDTSNYYYLTVRNTNVVELRKLQNGAINVLASAPLPVSLNRPYRLRLEASGRWIRGFVDGRQMLQTRDVLHRNGAAGIRMYKTAADYDSVVITPNPQTTLFSDDFNDDLDTSNQPQIWTTQQGTWAPIQDGTPVFEQTSLESAGHATAGLPADDQIVQARVKATRFSGPDRWFGLMARYRDEDNYYYVTMRSTNVVSLRKLVNGTVFILDSAALPVTTGKWYTLRMEVVGSSLRTYVDGRLLLEASDTSHAQGTYGLVTYKTTARFDDVSVVQP